MRRLVLTVAAVVIAVPLLGWAASDKQEKTTQKVVIPFDFESKFDDGRYGKMIGDMLWKKLEKQGGFVIPETMQDVRDGCERTATRPNPDTPLKKMKEIVVTGQAGDIGIWGKVERVAGFEEDVYDLWITVADFTVDPPKVIYELKKGRTKTVSEIPHVYVKEALDKLYGRQPPPPVAADPKQEERWAKGPNLVENGDFEKGTKAPTAWDPLPKHVSWVKEQESGSKIIRFTIPPDVAESSGVLYYSAFFPVEMGATYRFQCRYKTSGTAVKVFVKCYAELPTKFSKDGKSAQYERREVYRSQQNLKGGANAWNTQTEDFTPVHSKYTPRWGKVMLYGYYPAGTVEWDDVIVKQIAPPPSQAKR